MKIQLNGESREVGDSTSIADLLEELELDNRFLAVERNKELVPRANHQQTVLAEGDQLEVVTLVGGG